MGSSSRSEVSDNRVALEDYSGQFVSPESQLANPLGSNIAIEHGGHAEIAYGDVQINDLGGINTLVTTILESSQQSLDTVEQISSNVIDQAGSQQADLTGIVEAIKTPLAKYMPYAVLIGIVIIVANVKGAFK